MFNKRMRQKGSALFRRITAKGDSELDLLDDTLITVAIFIGSALQRGLELRSAQAQR
jgi:hypothetical protein